MRTAVGRLRLDRQLRRTWPASVRQFCILVSGLWILNSPDSAISPSMASTASSAASNPVRYSAGPRNGVSLYFPGFLMSGTTTRPPSPRTTCQESCSFSLPSWFLVL